MRWKKLNIAFILGVVISLCLAAIPAQAQFFLPDIKSTSNILNYRQENPIVAGCIRLDARCIFKLAAPQSELAQRLAEVQYNLDEASEAYFEAENVELKVQERDNNNLNDIYVYLNDRPYRILTVTYDDASWKGVSLDQRSEEITNSLKSGLKRGKRQRQPEYLEFQVIVTAITVLVGLVVSSLIARNQYEIKTTKKQLKQDRQSETTLNTQLFQQQQWNVNEVKDRVLQLLMIIVWIGVVVIILGLFPQTRIYQLYIITVLRIPFRVILTIIATYLCIRLSYAAIARFTGALADTYVINQTNRRLQLRINTISGVAKSIVTLIWFVVGIVAALALVGVNVTPLIAGAGIIGLALSLAAQNILKDAINGFLIILEDQYAVGDVIGVGDLGGKVETINLRITQIRDAEGKLITIPNSEIRIVANQSNGWSRSDLSIPIAYQTDLERGIEIIRGVALTMQQDEQWRKKILEEPEILGVENFGDRGVVVRVWIKTEPLEQWDIAREFRRRLMLAFKTHNIPLPLPQQQIWLGNQNN